MRDVAEVRHAGAITTADRARGARRCSRSTSSGSSAIDRELLRAIVEHFDGGPVGLSTLAVALGEEPDTIEDVYEPYLLQLGFLQRTPRGRIVTKLGRAHVGARSPPATRSFETARAGRLRGAHGPRGRALPPPDAHRRDVVADFEAIRDRHPGLTLEQNLIDLGWHQKEFQRRSSFAYTVVDPADDGHVLGCAYIYPTDEAGFDALATCWVRGEAAELDRELYEAFRAWIEREWPFGAGHVSWAGCLTSGFPARSSPPWRTSSTGSRSRCSGSRRSTRSPRRRWRSSSTTGRSTALALARAWLRLRHAPFPTARTTRCAERLIVPLKAISRIELARAEEHRERFGFVARDADRECDRGERQRGDVEEDVPEAMPLGGLPCVIEVPGRRVAPPRAERRAVELERRDDGEHAA